MNYRLRLFPAATFYALLIYAGLLLFSINYQPVVPGLDPSWAFALNQFAHGPELFGRDIVLTYGPLAYLAVPLHIGSNLQIALVVRVIAWCVLLYLLLSLWESGRRAGALFFTVALICSNRLFYEYWDYLLGAIAMLAVLLLIRKPDNPSILAILILTIGLSFLVKFTAFILAMLLLVLYTAGRFLIDRAVSSRERFLLALAFASAPLAYLIYNPSLTDFVGYVRGSLAMSSGYSAVMSSPITRELGWMAVILCGMLAGCAVLCFARKWVTPAGAAMVIATGWVAFKHGYVRSDPSHAAMFSCFIILAMAFLLAQMSYTARKGAAFSILFAGFSVYALQGASQRWPVWSQYWWSPGYNLAQAAQLLKWKQATVIVDERSDDAFRTSVINDYAAALGHSRVLFFPWDVAYGFHRQFTTVPLYATQAYSAYTHFLDEQSAIHIAKASPPIDYVLLEWKSVDARNPFLDVPATWNALFRQYAPVSSQGDAMLLRRRTTPLSGSFVEIAKTDCPGETWSQVPSRSTPVAMSLELKPTFLGSAVIALYQLGPVNMEVQTRSGLAVTMRFPPDVVSSPFPINYLPLNAILLNSLWKDNVVSDPIVRFRLTGSGLPYLHCDAVHFYDVTGTSVRVL